jgi:2-keto-3-deoxy-L-rhamnonate aldolase RhmA
MERILTEFEGLDYLMIDNARASTFVEVKDILSRLDSKVILLARIGDLQTLKQIDNIVANTAGVELAMNYFCKQLSPMEVKLNIYR